MDGREEEGDSNLYIMGGFSTEDSSHESEPKKTQESVNLQNSLWITGISLRRRGNSRLIFLESEIHVCATMAEDAHVVIDQWLQSLVANFTLI